MVRVPGALLSTIVTVAENGPKAVGLSVHQAGGGIDRNSAGQVGRAVVVRRIAARGSTLHAVGLDLARARLVHSYVYRRRWGIYR